MICEFLTWLAAQWPRHCMASRARLWMRILSPISSWNRSTNLLVLGADFYADDEMIRGAIEHRSSFNLIHLEAMFKVDVFIPKDRSFDRMQFNHRVEHVFAIEPDQKAFFTSAEDIILAKLDWYRLGNEVSDRQWRDILGVLKVQAGRLNMDYLHHWAAELNVADLLQRALKESE